MTQVLKTAPALAQDAVGLYDGQVLLHFDKAKHAYHVTENGSTRRVPSVTQILGVMDKPGLLQWAANCAAELRVWRDGRWVSLLSEPMPAVKQQKLFEVLL